MSLELLSVLLFLAQAITTKTSGAELVNDCPLSRCSQSAPEIRLPLSLNSAPPYCRLFSGLNLSCSADNTTLLLHSPSSNIVSAVDYDRGLIRLSRPWAACPWQTNSTNDDFDHTSSYCRRIQPYLYGGCYYFYSMYNVVVYTLTKCTAELASSIISNESIAGPISCLSGTVGSDRYDFVYALDSLNVPMNSLPSNCSVVSRGTANPRSIDWTRNLTFRERMEDFSRTVPWDYDDNDCTRCSFGGGSCGYNQATNKTFCINSYNQDDNHGEHLDPLDTIFNFTHIYHSEAMSHGFHTIRLRHGDTNSISILTCPNVSHSFHIG